MERIERRLVFPVPPDRLWAAVTDGDELSAWFGAHVRLDPRIGAGARFTWPDGRQRGAVVESVTHATRLSFRWLPFLRWRDGTVTSALPGRVELALRPVKGGTELTVIEWVALTWEPSARPMAFGAVP